MPAPLQRLRAFYVARAPRTERNTATNTRDNIARHYDLSNDLFATFLDETLSYSSALFDGDRRPGVAVAGETVEQSLPTQPAEWSALAAGQARKIERMLDQAGVTSGSRVLEIGTGWGELAIRAAARGATVLTVTLSSEQQALARERIAAAGFADVVDVELLDYRAVQGEFDAVVSVEMIEAVGHEYWKEYFQTIDRVLAPGGKVAIQAITMPHDRMLATRYTYTWITKYIFPGGFLPSTEAITTVTAEHTQPARGRAALLRPALRRDAAAVGRAVPQRAGSGPPAGVRRRVRADVALLPRVLAGGLPLGLSRRPAGHPRAALPHDRPGGGPQLAVRDAHRGGPGAGRRRSLPSWVATCPCA